MMAGLVRADYLMLTTFSNSACTAPSPDGVTYVIGGYDSCAPGLLPTGVPGQVGTSAAGSSKVTCTGASGTSSYTLTAYTANTCLGNSAAPTSGFPTCFAGTLTDYIYQQSSVTGVYTKAVCYTGSWANLNPLVNPAPGIAGGGLASIVPPGVNCPPMNMFAIGYGPSNVCVSGKRTTCTGTGMSVQSYADAACTTPLGSVQTLTAGCQTSSGNYYVCTNAAAAGSTLLSRHMRGSVDVRQQRLHGSS